MPLTDAERSGRDRLAMEAGLEVFGEVGLKDAEVDGRRSVAQAGACFAAGRELALVEAAELVADGRLDAGLSKLSSARSTCRA